ncbi:MAG: C-GCAxxG-C-C family protein [Eubacteriaceae bacterium]|nr:C-GCAxxG-C-C family protein [Eubacteriaceae bacterium]
MFDETIKAIEYFCNGMYCSQAVFGAFSEKYGLSKDIAFNISCGLNSGARCADICGAVTGGILVIGLKYGADKQKCNRETELFIPRFVEQNGSSMCRDILGCDITTTAGKQAAAAGNLFGTVCPELVENAVDLLADMGY